MGFAETRANAREQQTAQRVREAARLLITSSAKQAVPMNIIGAAGVGAMLYGTVPLLVLSAWVGAMVIASVLRLLSINKARKSGEVPTPGQMTGYMICTGFVGALWGAAGFLLPGDAGMSAVLAVAVMISGMSAGAAMTSAAEPRVVLAYNVPCLSLAALWYASFWSVTGFVLAGMALLFFAVTTRLAATYRKSLVETVEANASLEEARNESDAQREALSRLAERHEKAAGAAEDAARHKAAMLANMSHELGAPLNSILAMTQMLQDAALPGEAQRMVGRIAESGDALAALVAEIMDVSRIEAGSFELRLDDFPAERLRDRLVRFGTPRAGSKGLDFDVSLNIDEKLHLRGDQERLAQMAEIFVANAVRYTETGAVNVSFDMIAAGSDGTSRLRVAVSDTGRGVREQHREHLFDAFAQEAAKPASGGSTGLSLHLAKRIAAMMGGEVGFTPGDPGSVFWFEVPLRTADRPGRAGDERLAFANRRLRMLVCESDPARRAVMLGYLKSFNCVVSCATSVSDMLEGLGASAYDAIILGLNLGSIEPEDAVQDIRMLASTASLTPIVRLAPHLQEPVQRAGSEVLVRSPITSEPLLQALEEALVEDPSAIAYLRRTA
ncbi:MAG: sensory box histidine kinase/response regulator [Oceanicaulis sp. HLUCCA04]|nr:MAG: sensory box histidine kinase/response regulator [Oceanicaulis sp. HLUCCA04]